MQRALLQTVLPLAYLGLIVATIILTFMRGKTKNVSPAPGSIRWMIQIIFLFVLIAVFFLFVEIHPVTTSSLIAF